MAEAGANSVLALPEALLRLSSSRVPIFYRQISEASAREPRTYHTTRSYGPIDLFRGDHFIRREQLRRA